MTLALSPSSRRGGFTLLEVVLASTAAALILIAVYSVFFRAVKMRDDATERAREARLRARAVDIIRGDLRSGFISGSFIASTLEGGTANSRSNFPGSLRMTMTAAPKSVEELVGDVQEVEYYIVTDPDAVSRNAGVLVRAVDRDLMEPIRPDIVPERVLGNVASM
ncbi:MAG: PulJ/GspJ family protein, partial [Chthoniobacteraceae bacterium]